MRISDWSSDVCSSDLLAINRQVQPLVDQGASAIVVAIHQGLYSDLPPDAPGCDGIRGPLLEILGKIDPRVDLVVSGHTHQTYIRSEERRVGHECVRTCRSRWSPYN